MVGIIRSILTLILLVAFLMAGGCKLTDQINPEVHMQLVDKSRTWITVTPFDQSGLTASQLLQLIGIIEVASAVLLLVPVLDVLGCIGLLGCMVGAVYVDFVLYQPYILPAVLGGLVVLRLLLAGEAAPSSRKSKDE